jgi:hypothetical protein
LAVLPLVDGASRHKIAPPSPYPLESNNGNLCSKDGAALIKRRQQAGFGDFDDISA